MNIHDLTVVFSARVWEKDAVADKNIAAVKTNIFFIERNLC